MQPDAGALLWDARRAAELILDFVAGRTWQDYQSDAMLRSAVERQSYATIDDVLVWEVATTRINSLIGTLSRLLIEGSDT